MQATDFIHDPGVDHLTAAMHKACAGKQLRVGGMGRLMFAASETSREGMSCRFDFAAREEERPDCDSIPGCH